MTCSVDHVPPKVRVQVFTCVSWHTHRAQVKHIVYHSDTQQQGSPQRRVRFFVCVCVTGDEAAPRRWDTSADSSDSTTLFECRSLAPEVRCYVHTHTHTPMSSPVCVTQCWSLENIREERANIQRHTQTHTGATFVSLAPILVVIDPQRPQLSPNYFFNHVFTANATLWACVIAASVPN